MSDNKLQIFLIGDSTVQTYGTDDAPQAGWGQYIHRYFTSHAHIQNHAIGGRSTKTFYEEGRLAPILDGLKQDDYVLIQLGHNDASKNKPERYTDPFTSYQDFLETYIQLIKEHNGRPVLITPVARLHYENGHFMNDFEDYCKAMKNVAETEQVPLIDLMSRSLQHYEAIGYDEAQTLFMVSVKGEDYTHFTEKGADVIARLVADEIKHHEQLALSSYVKSGVSLT
ncbi:rhamnogalacturonan acetylesterase [Caldalkalibacillus salinus]|uniref:rhamnogalacturonan acetylesterase n=1 Tax=Caldalkalibacillus salinus TaxID=2803787 RepID=UPI001920B3C2|nr:rhamnogalacturonan acetylesterase [Caldalkalibacillus salinus]